MERGFSPSGTPGSQEYQGAAREVGDSSFIISDLRGLRYRTLRALYSSYSIATWGSASLHPRLYAIAALRGLRKDQTADALEYTFLYYAAPRQAEAYRTREAANQSREFSVYWIERVWFIEVNPV